MNETIQLLHNHRSIRKFTSEKLSNEQVRIIVEAGQRASTSSNVMAYSIIGVTDDTLKKELQKVSGQPYVEDNGYLFVICADLKRHVELASDENKDAIINSIETTEQFIVTVTDAALVTQNMVIAAESLGLGICFLGSLRNDIKRVDSLLNLPDYVIPLYGLAVGYPEHKPEVKPRLPFEAVFHENGYEKDKQRYIEDYDETLYKYYKSRSSNNRADNWSNQMVDKFSQSTRTDVGPYVQSKKLNQK
ncbi:oxygen-insensitive NADPH nitroreductase [Oceanobacillus sp. CAU 1775]